MTGVTGFTLELMQYQHSGVGLYGEQTWESLHPIQHVVSLH